MFLDNISLGKKLFGGFLIMIAIALIIAWIGYSAMGGMTSNANRMYDQNLMSLDHLLSADTSFLNIRVNIYKTVFAADERKEKFEEINQEIVNIKSQIDTYRKTTSTPTETALLKQFDDNWPIFEKSLREIISNMNDGNEKAALDGIYGDDFKVPRDAAQEALDKLEAFNMEQARLLKDDTSRTYHDSSLLFLFIGLFSLVFGLLFALVLTRGITVPLQKAVDMIQEMRMDHLGRRLEMRRRDEIGDMAGIMDAFADNLQNNVVETMKKIAAGEPVDRVAVMDDQDEIGPALKITTDTLSRLIKETEQLTYAASNGNLTARGDESMFSGGFKAIISGFNLTLDNVMAPLTEAMKLSSRYADGDFSSRFSDSVQVMGDFIPFRDAMNTIGIESGKAMGSVITEVNGLLNGMDEINVSTEEITSGAHVLAENSARVGALSERASNGIQQILHTMNDLSTTVSAVATETNEVALLTRNTDDLSLEGTRLVKKTEEGMKNIKISFEETYRVVQEINQQMGEIGSIVGVISDLADQTNLLALNAAIEAARAGDAGLGFAVVAGEVKTLAGESRSSAEKIADLISGLQKKSEDVSDSMNRSQDDVQAGDVAVKETLQVFQKIAGSIGDVSRRVSGVAGTTEEQAASVEEISASMNELSDMVEQTAKEAVDSSAATEQASAALDQIARVITDTTVSVDRISGAMSRFVI